MAAVTIPLSPHVIGVMASHRPPLASIPNVGNSPFPRNAVTPVKRSRSRSNAGENTPPFKKQVFDEKNAPRTPTRKVTIAKVEKNPKPERQIVGRTLKHDRGDADTQSLETVLQWQRHYRKMFPSYVFYFENILEDTRRRCVRAVESLGAREAKFFSKEVTHVITTRSVPSEEEPSRGHNAGVEELETTSHNESQPRTINPSLLDKTNEQTSGLHRSKFSFDLASIRKGNAPPADSNARKPAASGVDILQKAKELGIKIWQLEKLMRVLRTIIENPQTNDNQVSKNGATGNSKALKQVDLSQMIKNEKIHERGDREINTTATELIKFTGPYLYVRDMNEKTKPILVREYSKVDRKEDGEWPQFRSAASGKCPFIEEEAQSHKIKELREEKARHEVREQSKARTHEQSGAKPVTTSMQPPATQVRRKPLIETASAANSARQACQLPPPPARNDPTFTNGASQQVQLMRTKFINGEPTASGMQPSNITSAIRSQMISSTAAAPGAKAGTSKEIHDLQRKAVERVGLQHSKRMHDIASYNRAARAMTRAASKEPTTIDETDENEARLQEKTKPTEAARTHAPRQEKPGYCENCRVKFKDFEEHVVSRKHKKFATDISNWHELDQLLTRLVRPLTSET